MDTIKTIDKTVVHNAQEKRKEFIINLFEKRTWGACILRFSMGYCFKG